MTKARVEIVATDEGQHLRFVDRNGETIVTTGVLDGEDGAEMAIFLIGSALGADLWFAGDEWKNTTRKPYRDLNVVHVDERVI